MDRDYVSSDYGIAMLFALMSAAALLATAGWFLYEAFRW